VIIGMLAHLSNHSTKSHPYDEIYDIYEVACSVVGATVDSVVPDTG
jgi:hypothetical protein